ncbi:hypothetical protein DIU31_031535 [Mucilaginibacter rubeus]|uniref:Uncharacterized protein n=1 Tax=Mucilaginibacter rubeus TaxID=2027860 RepID=A0AAE6JL92_9SPHI|nr:MULTISPECIES: hypothetical protein [Mucilaginibacter]QEM07814.1 hypothetical protein DIU31_031535 [Mucilaginibacter rubeus]QEM20266.1 hypothetical protein DIU38_031140 [Mucilaginibacter gossypii]QTE43017.1 hypothetical protein J3L19_29530 [Mucilaginibacter rubeus]QTE49618.1 hypothetical protein J3L21_29490 [Mucilaginibacter rubeus]QTE54713.1 hypothetical protein J3L23_21110 [Mucilaginibacter rubeus]
MVNKISDKTALPDFSSLTGIMKRFHEVPYDQLQRELNEYFEKNLAATSPELSNLQQANLVKFRDQIMKLMNDLFAQADLVQECKSIIDKQ